MARSKFIAEEIDFDGIERGMAALEPPKLALEEVLKRLRPRMQEQRARGVTVEQLAELLKGQGIEVGVRNLTRFIEKGELLGGRPKRGRGTETEPVAGENSGEEHRNGAGAEGRAVGSGGDVG